MPEADRDAARRAAWSLGISEGDRRRAALARFVDLLDPTVRPAVWPQPGAVADIADPLDELAGCGQRGARWWAHVRVPWGLVVGEPATVADAAAVCGRAIATGNALRLPQDRSLAPVLAAAETALGEAGLPEAAIAACRDLGEAREAADAVLVDGRPQPRAAAPRPLEHVYLDGAADREAALNVSRAAGQAAADEAGPTFLVHEALASALVEDLVAALASTGLQAEAGEAARRRAPQAQPASAETWTTHEPGRCGVRVVGSLAEALEHGNRDGGRSEAIVTSEAPAAHRFARGACSRAIVVQAAPHEAEIVDELPAPSPPADGGALARWTGHRTVLVGGRTEAPPADASTLAELLRAGLA